MTKKDYELIARVLKREKPIDTEGQEAMANWRMTCHALATAFRIRRDNFNRTKFLQACGIEEN